MAVVAGVFSGPGVSESFAIPPGRVFVLIRVAFTGSGRVVAMRSDDDGENWDYHSAHLQDHDGRYEKRDGRPCLMRLECSAASGQIDYTLTFERLPIDKAKRIPEDR